MPEQRANGGGVFHRQAHGKAASASKGARRSVFDRLGKGGGRGLTADETRDDGEDHSFASRGRSGRGGGQFSGRGRRGPRAFEGQEELIGSAGGDCGGGRATCGDGAEAFAEEVTYAGHADHFVVAGETWVHCRLYEALLPRGQTMTEGVLLVGTRAPGSEGRCKWKAVSLRRIEVGAPATAPQPFSEVVSYAGRSAQFVVAGDTFVPSAAYTRLLPIYEGDRLSGRRVRDSNGSRKWRAVSVDAIERAAAAQPKGHAAAWLDRSRQLLLELSLERASLPPLSASELLPNGCDSTAAESEGGHRAEVARPTGGEAGCGPDRGLSPSPACDAAPGAAARIGRSDGRPLERAPPPQGPCSAVGRGGRGRSAGRGGRGQGGIGPVGGVGEEG